MAFNEVKTNKNPQVKTNKIPTFKLAVSAVSLNFVHDFTLCVPDIHQIMLISLFPTPFDHFHPSAGLIS